MRISAHYWSEKYVSSNNDYDDNFFNSLNQLHTGHISAVFQVRRYLSYYTVILARFEIQIMFEIG